jgi:large subunit ribosomal protein L30
MATIKIKQIKSKIGYPVDQKRTLQALGLHKISQVVEKEDSPAIRGMIRKVRHLVTIVED